MLTLESDVVINMQDMKSKFNKIILKNKEILISIMLLLVIPIASSFILGYEFSGHQIGHVPTVIVDHDNSTLSASLVKQINTNDTFNVTNYSENNDDVKNLIDKGNVAVGIIIPDDFSKDLIEGKAPKIMVIYDGSQMSAVGATKGKISEVLGTIKAGYLISLEEGKLGLMPDVAKSSVVPIQYNSRFIGNPTKNTPNFMLEGLVIAITQIGIVILGIIISDEKNYLWLLIKGIICGLIGSIAISVALMIQVKYFGVPYNGSFPAGIILTILYSIGMTNIGILIGVLTKDKASAISSSMGLVSATILLSGYTFPVLAMPDIFTSISKYVPFLYYGIPLRDLSLMGSSFNDILPNVYWLIKLTVIMWISILIVFILKNGYKYIKENKRWNLVLKRRCKDEASKVHN